VFLCQSETNFKVQSEVLCIQKRSWKEYAKRTVLFSKVFLLKMELCYISEQYCSNKADRTKNVA
jgi:hypothetical protein